MFNFQTYTNLQNMRKWVMGILLMLIGASVFAQNNRGRVSGNVIDADDKSPVIQATVQLLSLPDSTMITGNVTDNNGRFPSGQSRETMQ